MTGPGWSGTVPPGTEADHVGDPLHGHTGANFRERHRADYKIVNGLQAQYKLTHSPPTASPLTTAPPVNPNPGFSMTDTPQKVINAIDTSPTSTMATLMGKAAPPAAERSDTREHGQDWSGARATFDISKLNPAVQAALKNANKAGVRAYQADRRASVTGERLGRCTKAWELRDQLLKQASVAAFG